MATASDPDAAVPFSDVKKIEIEDEIGLHKDQQDQLLGLAFSGGGIRSATFNLGILQALGELKLLHCFDYLSTVSGGGYIGSWLACWIRKLDDENPDLSGLLRVEKALSPALKDSPDPDDDRVQPIQFLRRYSNYLTPQSGFFSADTWTMVSIWLRNTFLNLLILVTFLTGVLLIPRWFVGLTDAVQKFSALDFAPLKILPGAVVAAFAALALGVAARYIGKNLRLLDTTKKIPREKPNARDSHNESPECQQGGIQKRIVVSVFAAAWLGSAAFSNYANTRKTPAITPIWACVVTGGLFAAFLIWTGIKGRYYRCFYQNAGTAHGSYTNKQKRLAICGIVSCALISAAVGGTVLYGLVDYLQEYCNSINVWHVMSWGTPIFMTLFTFAIVLYIGLLGSNLPDDRREWWSRLGAWLIIYNICWAGCLRSVCMDLC